METLRTDRSGSPRLLRGLFAAAVVLFLCSLLVLMSAPTTALWIIAIVASEWGHWFAFACLLIVVVTVRRSRLGATAAAIAAVASSLYVLPLIQATWICRMLPERCTAAFGDAARENRGGRAAPLEIADLFRGIRHADVEVTERTYAMVGKKPLKLDLYRRKDVQAPQPLVVVIHGGAWSRSSKQELPAINRYLASQQHAVASINYRHAPRWPFPAAIEDVFRAIDYLKTHAADLRLDTTRIALLGRSAGGQIALSVAYAGKEPALRGVVSFYAPTDLVLGYKKPSRRWVLDSKTVLEEYLRGGPEQNPEDYAAASPVHQVGDATPPTLLIHGGLDPVVWPIHSELLAARLQQAARPHLYLAFPWATHGCEANLSGPSGQLSLYAIDRFLAAVFAPSDSASSVIPTAP
jgi:acetyl esterase/lipase